MKKFLLGFVAVALVAVGCENKSPPGGPGANPKPGGANTTARGQGGDTFKLENPGSMTLKQGEQIEQTLKIDRGDNFKQPVTLTFDNLPKGVTMVPASIEIQSGNSQARVAVKAANDAPTGEHDVTVVAKPQTGAQVEGKLKVKVERGGHAK
jgi:uncharacterized membrane protein